MGVCNSKVCSAIVCDRGSNCGSLKPSMCGNRSLAYPSGSCKGLRIEGATDTTINQGVGIDLTEDVHAYDGFGNEIPFEVEPETIEKCEVGEHTVKYTAVGEASIMNPTVCGRNELHTSDECSKLDRIERERTITITQADPPTISGVDEVTIDTNTDFSPSEGVSAVDDNGNVVSFEYNGMYDLEASGEIASFETEFAQSAKSLKVTLEPKQDLHGYDKPWSGGNGVNKFDYAKASFNNSIPAYGFTISVSGTTVTVQGTAIGSGNRSFTVVNNYADDSLSGKGYVCQALDISGTHTIGNAWGFRTETEKTFAIELRNVTDGETVNVTFKISVAETSQTTWTPYSNICPISGRTEVDTQRCGKNLFDAEEIVEKSGHPSQCYIEDGYLKFLTGNPTLFGMNWTDLNIPCPCTLSGTIKNFATSSTANIVAINAYFDDGSNQTRIRETLSAEASKQVSGTIGASGKTLVRLATSWMTGLRAGLDLSDTQLELGSTKTDFEAFTKETYTTDLGQTVYGGTLDVVSGELVVDKGYIASYNGETLPSTWISDRDEYASGTTPSIGAEVVYELATPQTIQLTPTEVDLLLGNNNVWSDGDVSVVYSADIPQGEAFKYPLKGTYEITYTAEDECGNKAEVTRTIEVA